MGLTRLSDQDPRQAQSHSIHQFGSSERVEVCRPESSFTILRAEDELAGEDVLPGFRCRVGEIFPM